MRKTERWLLLTAALSIAACSPSELSGRSAEQKRQALELIPGPNPFWV